MWKKIKEILKNQFFNTKADVAGPVVSPSVQKSFSATRQHERHPLTQSAVAWVILSDGTKVEVHNLS